MATDLITARKGSDDGVGLRKGATLTGGPGVSATRKERKARAHASWASGARWARPKAHKIA
jgi:hypothetical protein